MAQSQAGSESRDRRTFIIATVLSVAVILTIALLGSRHPSKSQPVAPTAAGTFTRVIFVCVDRDGNYSPGVYVQGASGADGLDLISKAAPFMSTAEIGDAAAGLCGYLYKQCGDDVAGGGCLSLYDSPKPAANGKVDWQSYCAPNVDLVLAHVELGTAELYSGSADPKSPVKSLVRTITGLTFGSGGSASEQRRVPNQGPKDAEIPSTDRSADAIVAAAEKGKGFGDIHRAEFSNSGRRILAVWYCPFSGSGDCLLHAYSFDRDKHEWIQFESERLKSGGDLAVELPSPYDTLNVCDSSGALLRKLSLGKVPGSDQTPTPPK